MASSARSSVAAPDPCAVGTRESSAGFSESGLASDPALEAFGWAASGPWAVVVIRSRVLTSADEPALRAALEATVRLDRPGLRFEPQLSLIASEAVADNLIDDDDRVRFGRAGGVPVHLSDTSKDIILRTDLLHQTLELAKDGPGGLRDPWLDQFGLGVKVSDDGTVTFVVLATGAADRAALSRELAAAEEGASESADAFDWDLKPPDPGDEQLTRFGAAAGLAPDGTVWALVALDY